MATTSPTSTPLELKPSIPRGPNHMIVGAMVTPITVHVSWNSEPSVKSPHDVTLMEELVAGDT